MKKILFPIVLVSALMTIISCAKSFDAQEEGLVASSESKTFTATIESDDNNSKTTLANDGKTVNWEDGDKIAILDNSGTGNCGVYTATPKTPAPQAPFTFADEGTAASTPKFVAYYPASICWSGTEKTAPTLPATQTCDGTFALNPMYAFSDDTNLEFKNICSVIKLKTNFANVSSIELSTDKYLSGQFTINPENYAMTMSGTAADDNKVTLNVANDYTPTADNEGYYYYYIAIPAQQYSTLTIKVTAGGNTKTMTKKMPSESLARNTIYNLTFKPNVLPGVFSVSATKKVQFSCGNLHCTRTSSGSNDWTWHFYDEQYKYNSLSTSSSRTANASDLEIDLFTWGYGTWSTDPKTSTYLTGTSNLSGNTDWGHLMGDGWFTLSKAEWEYLLGKASPSRTNAINLYKRGVLVCEKTNCVVIAPDGYTGTIQSSYDASTWPTAEAEGLVCLPAAGYRDYGSSVSTVGSSVQYWSSTLYGKDYAYFLYFNSYAGMSAVTKSRGFSVRLVRESE